MTTSGATRTVSSTSLSSSARASNLPMRTLDDLLAHGPDSVRGRRILVRSDLNVPLSKDATPTVTDDGRIRASLPVLTTLLDHGARVIVAAHLGRPKGAPESKYSLRPVA